MEPFRMERRPLGNTGLTVPLLSFGASSLGQEFRAVDLGEALKSVHVALDLGMDFIDTSPFYGRGMSEVLLGAALRGVPRDRYLLGTKLGRYDAAHFDFSARRVAESIDVSLHRMGVSHLDLVLCHDLEFVEMAQIVEETLPALRKQQQLGKVRFVGISGYPMKMFRYVLDRAPVDVVLSYNHYTLQNTMLADLLPYLQGKGAGVLNAAPFSARLLTNQPLPPWHKATPRVREVAAAAAARCRQAIFDRPPRHGFVRGGVGEPREHPRVGRLGGETARPGAAVRGAGDPQADPQLALHGGPAGKQRPALRWRCVTAP
jgi:L-galactose dehydrogenase